MECGSYSSLCPKGHNELWRQTCREEPVVAVSTRRCCEFDELASLCMSRPFLRTSQNSSTSLPPGNLPDIPTIAILLLRKFAEPRRPGSSWPNSQSNNEIV